MSERPEHEHERLEATRSAACEQLEDVLPDAARVLREGGELEHHYPELARHLGECEWCRTTLDELSTEPDLFSELETEIDSHERFDAYLAAALEQPEPIARVRAAERAADAQRVGPRSLAALARGAAEDPEASVRAAALRALDGLEVAVAIPAIAELSGTSWAEGRMSLTGTEGVSGTLSVEGNELRLTVEGLPPEFENTLPVVAAPGALRTGGARVEWSGTDPGLVSVEAAVTAGRLNVRLGRLLDPSAEPALAPELERLLVLNPEASGERS